MINRDKLHNSLDVLGLPQFVSFREIKESYRALSRKTHPDFGGDRDEFERVNSAYEILKIYVENFRFTFSDEEIYRQYPEANHAKRFRI